jgi:hypothetical protein
MARKRKVRGGITIRGQYILTEPSSVIDLVPMQCAIDWFEVEYSKDATAPPFIYQSVALR